MRILPFLRAICINDNIASARTLGLYLQEFFFLNYRRVVITGKNLVLVTFIADAPFLWVFITIGLVDKHISDILFILQHHINRPLWPGFFSGGCFDPTSLQFPGYRKHAVSRQI